MRNCDGVMVTTMVPPMRDYDNVAHDGRHKSHGGRSKEYQQADESFHCLSSRRE